MRDEASISLPMLRDIGWREWDPIGLSPDDPCPDDEYDRYLLHVVSRLQGGEADPALVDYLVEIEIDHMGLNPNPTARVRASATVAAIRRCLAGSN
jgi:hypothetical protein